MVKRGILIFLGFLFVVVLSSGVLGQTCVDSDDVNYPPGTSSPTDISKRIKGNIWTAGTGNLYDACNTNQFRIDERFCATGGATGLSDTACPSGTRCFDLGISGDYCRWECTDTDGGYNIDVRGTVAAQNYPDDGYNADVYEDYCQDATHVVEYECNGIFDWVGTSVLCPNGGNCNLGKCDPAPLSCNDPDNTPYPETSGDASYLTKSTLIDSDGFPRDDACISGDVLLEYACDGSNDWGLFPSCSANFGAGWVCQNGRCVAGGGGSCMDNDNDGIGSAWDAERYISGRAIKDATVVRDACGGTATQIREGYCNAGNPTLTNPITCTNPAGVGNNWLCYDPPGSNLGQEARCVECLSNSDCGAGGICSGNSCSGSACGDGVCSVGETCANDNNGCGAGVCQTSTCSNGCNINNLPNGNSCPGGTCQGGSCIACGWSGWSACGGCTPSELECGTCSGTQSRTNSCNGQVDNQNCPVGPAVGEGGDCEGGTGTCTGEVCVPNCGDGTCAPNEVGTCFQDCPAAASFDYQSVGDDLQGNWTEVLPAVWGPGVAVGGVSTNAVMSDPLYFAKKDNHVVSDSEFVINLLSPSPARYLLQIYADSGTFDVLYSGGVIGSVDASSGPVDFSKEFDFPGGNQLILEFVHTSPIAISGLVLSSFCGDGEEIAGLEECDDGDSTDMRDGSESGLCIIDRSDGGYMCEIAECGDGYLSANGADGVVGGGDDEECDGGSLGNDYCNPDCTFTLKGEFCNDITTSELVSYYDPNINGTVLYESVAGEGFCEYYGWADGDDPFINDDSDRAKFCEYDCYGFAESSKDPIASGAWCAWNSDNDECNVVNLYDNGLTCRMEIVSGGECGAGQTTRQVNVTYVRIEGDPSEGSCPEDGVREVPCTRVIEFNFFNWKNVIGVVILVVLVYLIYYSFFEGKGKRKGKKRKSK